MQGYNYELISRLSKDLNIPIIAAGGAESYDHFYKAYINEASTFATSSMYHFTPNTTAKTKKFLKKKKYQ
jgi:cyclase